MSNKELAKNRRKRLLKNMTPAECRFREILRKHKIRFVCQKIVYVNEWQFYILDFYIPSLKLGIELDGSHHNKQKKKDNKRTKALNALGVSIVRFKNQEVWQLEEKQLLKSLSLKEK